jgi:hypothetical protein
MKRLIQYFYEIKFAKVVLWCYLIWYLVMICFYFDSSPKLWINSIGISLIIGTGLLLSVSSGQSGKRDGWQTFRLYLMPFCVSSFSALIKEQGFIVFISPNAKETIAAVSGCVLFILAVSLVKLAKRTAE